MALARLWPQPRPLLLGGRVYPVSPLRLRDLASLEQWAAHARGGGIVDDLADAAAIEDESARRAALRGLYDECEAGADPWANPDVGAMLATRAGMAEQIRLTVRRTRRGEVRYMRRSVAMQVARLVEPGDWAAWRHVAWCLDDLDCIAEAIDAEIGVVWPEPRAMALGPDEQGGWGKSLYAVVAGTPSQVGAIGATGWTLETLGDLTLGQWRWLASGGVPSHDVAEPKEPPRGVSEGEFAAAVRRPRAKFWAEYWAALSIGGPGVNGSEPGASGQPFPNPPDSAPPAI